MKLDKSKIGLMVLIVVVFASGIFIGVKSSSCLNTCELFSKESDRITPSSEVISDKSGDLILQIQQITESIPEKPGYEANDQQWDAWRTKDSQVRQERIGFIERLEKLDLSDEQMLSFWEMKIDDLESCFYYARLEANEFESKLYTMMEEGSPLSKTLATELFWSLNIYHVNTHLMHLSALDIQQIADFEMSRKAEPQAGRLIARAIRSGRIGKDNKVKWRTWVLENIPPTAEGHKLITARSQLRDAFGSDFEFSGQDINGNVINSKDLKGKVVLLEYWAFWCGICLAEIPELKEFNDKYYDKGLRIIGVFNDNKIDELRKYVKEKNITWPQLINLDSTDDSIMHPLAKKYGIKSLPQYLLIGPDGKLIKGHLRVEGLKTHIEELLGITVN